MTTDIPPDALDRFAIKLRKPMAVALMGTLLAATWSLLHHYQGLIQDGELYAFQAFARLHPNLRLDVYLAATSQDQYSLFSPLYALVMRFFGLWQGSAVLFAICTSTFVVAAWSMARSLWGETQGWLAAAMCIVVAGDYGAYDVFHYAESFLTARSMAEALVVTALACHLRGMVTLGWLVALASLLIHPLMTLPGLLLLTCLTVPLFYCFLGAVAGMAAALAIALSSLANPHVQHFFPILSGDWLEVVRERSHFLFLQNWRLKDWEIHARDIFCIGLAALVAADPRVRRICLSAALVGAAGLIVALIASSFGPVAVLLQGQAWRWFWITAMISVLASLPTAVRLWNDGGCGSVCATLLVASWTFPPVNGSYLAAAALCLWSARRYLQPPSQRILKALAFAMIAAILAWTIANIWSVCSAPPVAVTAEPLLVERLRSIYALQIPALLVVGFVLHWVRSGAAFYGAALALAALISLCLFAFPGSFQRNSGIGTRAEMQAMSPWRDAIPPTSNVLLVPHVNSAAIIWFSLQRPSYLTTDQSAGAVFSPITAHEILRRSEVLLPISEPDWKIMTSLALKKKQDELTHPLTPQRLMAICTDPQLGFVIAREKLGFSAIRAKGPGTWKDWNLYDCSLARQQAAVE